MPQVKCKMFKRDGESVSGKTVADDAITVQF